VGLDSIQVPQFSVVIQSCSRHNRTVQMLDLWTKGLSVFAAVGARTLAVHNQQTSADHIRQIVADHIQQIVADHIQQIAVDHILLMPVTTEEPVMDWAWAVHMVLGCVCHQECQWGWPCVTGVVQSTMTGRLCASLQLSPKSSNGSCDMRRWRAGQTRWSTAAMQRPVTMVRLNVSPVIQLVTACFVLIRCSNCLQITEIFSLNLVMWIFPAFMLWHCFLDKTQWKLH